MAEWPNAPVLKTGLRKESWVRIPVPPLLPSANSTNELPMTDRESRLNELGYEEPLDESPIDHPDNWNGGNVVNTGGGIMCRLWRSFEACSSFEHNIEFEVIYNLSNDASVGLQYYSWDKDEEFYVYTNLLQTRSADELSDGELANVALELMELVQETLEEYDRESAVNELKN